METKDINIAAILEDKPKGTKLFDALRGVDVCLDSVTWYIHCTKERSSYYYTSNGGVSSDYPNGLQILKPSKQMQDWSKFAWKKGDVLFCGVDNFCIFGGWANDDYTEFNAKYVTPNYSGAVLKTKDWPKVGREGTIKDHISKIEEIKGGTLNLETLEMEKQPQFKDGDILVREEDDARHYAKCILIYKTVGNKDRINCYVYYNDYDRKVYLNSYVYNGKLRLATDSEKQQLFAALEKEGKAWDADKKLIVDLPKKYEFKPFDKVVVRHGNKYYWGIDIFSNYGDEYHDKYQCLTDAYEQCLPYNENTAYLLGTTDDWKGGEE